MILLSPIFGGEGGGIPPLGRGIVVKNLSARSKTTVRIIFDCQERLSNKKDFQALNLRTDPQEPLT